MKFDREARIWTLLVIDVIFCVVELVTGTMSHSLALIADSFHMINDVVSLIIALYAIKAAKRPASNRLSYAWARAEVLGAFANATFLIALCFSIALEAIQRFVEVQEVSNPLLMTIVGGWGLASNVIGLFLFHEHGHSHGGHSHSHGDEEAAAAAPLVLDSSNGTKRTRSSSRIPHRTRSDSFSSLYGHPAVTRAAVIEVAQEYGYGKHERSTSAGMSKSPSTSQAFSPNMTDGEHGGNGIESALGNHGRGKSASRGGAMPTHQESEECHSHDHNHDHGHDHTDHAHEDNGGTATSGSSSTVIAAASHAEGHDHAHGDDQSGHDHAHDQGDDNHGHDHSHGPEASAGGGHSHSHGGSMNIQGVFLHVLGDALGNVGVIAAGLVILLCKGHWRYYFDPAISLAITVIIFSSALPLCKSAAFILLQGVPTHISLEDVRESISDVGGVLSLHELHIWQLSEKTVVASVHVLVSSGRDYMLVAKGIREALHAHGVHSSTIQPEFGSLEDDENGDACLIRCPPETCETEICCPPVGKLVDVEEGKGDVAPPPTGENAV